MPIYEDECRSCGKVSEYYSEAVTDLTRPCPDCGGVTDRRYSVCQSRAFTPFTTRHIDPDGKPIEVKSQSHLSSLCNQYGLVHADDPKLGPPPTSPKKIEREVPKY